MQRKTIKRNANRQSNPLFDNPLMNLARQENPGVTSGPRDSSGCWWTETGWYCCTSSNTPWPSCIPGGVTTQQRGYSPLPGLGLAASPARASLQAAIAAGVATARAPSVAELNFMRTRSSASAEQCIVVYYGGQAYICCGAEGTCIPLPILGPTDVDLSRPPTGGIARRFGLGFAAADRDRNPSVPQYYPHFRAQPRPQTSSTQAQAGGTWLPATFFDTRPSALTRRWIQLLQQGSGGLLLPAVIGETNYTAILKMNGGAQQRYVAVGVRPAGPGKVEARIIFDLPPSFDPDAPQGVPWDPSQQQGPNEWLPATFFNAAPSPMTRRWVKLTAQLADPRLYNGILFQNFGAQQESVTVQVRTVPQPGGGSKVEANLNLFPGFPPGVPPGGGVPVPFPNPDPWGKPIRLRRRHHAVAGGVIRTNCSNGWCDTQQVPTYSMRALNPAPSSYADAVAAGLAPAARVPNPEPSTAQIAAAKTQAMFNRRGRGR